MKKGFLDVAAAGGDGQSGVENDDAKDDLDTGSVGASADKKGASAAQVREPAVNLTKGLNNRFQLGPARKAPVVSMVLGMAGSGKTTLMQRIAVHIYEKQTPSYIINLDPAVSSVPYGCNIDIRDTVNYKEVMKQYQLGPNGGIMTALNLFATKFDQVMSLVEAKADALEHVFIDTPGQIEIFTWSASGTIISDMLAYSFPTVLLYVIDTPRTTSPVTFMSNMLYACSIMYKFKLPFIVVFNKTDITSADFALEWMTDYEKFQQAVAGETAYAGSLSSSMGLVLDEFYHNITAVAVSAVTGEGMDELFAKIDIAAEEYHREFRPMLEAKAQEKATREKKVQERKLKLMRKQMAAAAGGGEVGGVAGLGAAVRPGASLRAAGMEDGEEEEEEEEELGQEGIGRKASYGGVRAFEPDSDSDDDDGEDDYEYTKMMSQGPPPVDLMEQLQLRDKHAGGGAAAGAAGAAADMAALNDILKEVNDGKVVIEQ